MIRVTRRRAVIAVLVIALAAAAWQQVVPYIRVGVVYKAKMLCSGIFVSRLDPHAALTDLQRDDLAALKYIRSSANTEARTVSASALGVITRRAVYREGVGCTLLFDDAPLAPADSPEPAAVSSPLPTRLLPSPLADVVARAFDEPAPEKPRRTRAVVVLRRGEVIAERYAPGFTADTPLLGWSMTKSVMNALAGVLVRQGRMRLDTLVAGHNITLDHLLRMSSGLRFTEDQKSPGGDVIRMLFETPDMAAFAVSQPLEAPPGSRWQYSSGTTNIIARAIRNAFSSQAEYLRFPRQELFAPLGMASATIEVDAAGTFVGSSFMHATARDWARFGMLYLQDGVSPAGRILPEGWVAYTTTPAPADAANHYGAHFWLHVPEEYCASGDRLPSDAFHAAGHEAQFVTIVPSRELVIVRLGRTRYPEAWDHCAFVADVLTAVDGGAFSDPAPAERPPPRQAQTRHPR